MAGAANGAPIRLNFNDNSISWSFGLIDQSKIIYLISRLKGLYKNEDVVDNPIEVALSRVPREGLNEIGVHLKFHGDVKGAGKIGGNTIDKLAAFEPEKVLHWCPSCVLQFGETVEGFKPQPFEFQHLAHFLLSRLDDFRKSFRPIDRRVALHRHDGGLGIDRSVETILSAIPGLELLDFDEQEHWAYTCGPGALNNVEDMRRASHRQTVHSAVNAGADTVATLYHTCHRDLCVFEGQFPIKVHNWTEIVAEALGLPAQEDRYKRIKLHAEISAAIEDSREFIEANGLDATSLEAMLPQLMAGKDEGLSLW